jgi:hypothetical protein
MTEVTYLPTLDGELLARARRRRQHNGSAVDPWDVASETRRSGRLPFTSDREVGGRRSTDGAEHPAPRPTRISGGWTS